MSPYMKAYQSGIKLAEHEFINKLANQSNQATNKSVSAPTPAKKPAANQRQTFAPLSVPSLINQGKKQTSAQTRQSRVQKGLKQIDAINQRQRGRTNQVKKPAPAPAPTKTQQDSSIPNNFLGNISGSSPSKKQTPAPAPVKKKAPQRQARNRRGPESVSYLDSLTPLMRNVRRGVTRAGTAAGNFMDDITKRFMGPDFDFSAETPVQTEFQARLGRTNRAKRKATSQRTSVRNTQQTKKPVSKPKAPAKKAPAKSNEMFSIVQGGYGKQRRALKKILQANKEQYGDVGNFSSRQLANALGNRNFQAGDQINLQDLVARLKNQDSKKKQDPLAVLNRRNKAVNRKALNRKKVKSRMLDNKRKQTNKETIKALDQQDKERSIRRLGSSAEEAAGLEDQLAAQVAVDGQVREDRRQAYNRALAAQFGDTINEGPRKDELGAAIPELDRDNPESYGMMRDYNPSEDLRRFREEQNTLVKELNAAERAGKSSEAEAIKQQIKRINQNILTANRNSSML